MNAPRDAHLFAPGPKRVLALDGGGTLGIIELGFLGRIEALLRDHHGGDPAFRLSDWFDLIGGTSTGAIIAAGLATGLSVAEITTRYMGFAPLAFRRRGWRNGLLLSKFDAKPLMQFLHDSFGDQTLDTDGLRTGFAVVARRYDTGSPWLIANNPRAPYWADPADDSYIGNRRFRLAEIVRASAAAPGFFPPQWLKVTAAGRPGLFVDGALTPHNNPSLALLMMTQARAYGLCWPVGAEALSLVSIGAGHYRRVLAQDARPPRLSATLAAHALLNSISDAQMQTLTLLQFLSAPGLSWPINSEIGDLSGELLGGRALLSFQRYDMPLEQDWLAGALGLTIAARELEALRHFDAPANMQRLHDMAVRVAATQVQLSHLLPPAAV